MEKTTGVLKTETWKNVSAGVAVINKFDKFGERVKTTVGSNQTVQVTAEERQFNDTLAYNEEDSVFRNGVMAPLVLTEDTLDAEQIQSNKNLMSEQDIVDLLSGHYKTLEKFIAELSNLNTLIRIHKVAVQRDIANSRIRLLRARVSEVNPLHLFDDDED